MKPDRTPTQSVVPTVGRGLLAFSAGVAWAFHWDNLLRDPLLAQVSLLSQGLHERLARSWSLPHAALVAGSLSWLAWLYLTMARRHAGTGPAPGARAAVRPLVPLFAFTVFDLAWLWVGWWAGPEWTPLRRGLALGLLPLHTLVPAAVLCGLMGALGRTRAEDGESPRGPCKLVFVAAGLYAFTFSTLSILQYRALMVPHGDTAMYEEHLWNLLHGKGFRSQLDGGRLFLGEHIQFIHVFLIPIYMLWPSLPTLNVVYSAALASGSIAVWYLARAKVRNSGAATWLALAYLLYPPLQYLNLEASLKTFRPENLAVPLILFALVALEARRYLWMLALLGLALTAKEDYTLVVAMVGVALALRHGAEAKARALGAALALGGVVYLWLTLTVLIPYSRGGPPHYMAYYASLGKTPAEVATRLLQEPEILVRRLLTLSNAELLLALLVPLGGLPLLGWRRLGLALPNAASLLLGDLEGLKLPVFHFHAPLLPFLFWAAADGLHQLDQRSLRRGGRWCPSLEAARLAWCCAFWAGFWVGRSPSSLAFYDPHAGLKGYWRALYVPGERVERFYRFYEKIPTTSSIAASDYVRPRFTHHRECHELGVKGLKPHVRPEQIDYLVVDLRGPYSDVRGGLEVPHRVRHPHGWETVYWDEYFLVLRAGSGRRQ
jgi:uncharacterized membrane protein